MGLINGYFRDITALVNINDIYLCFTSGVRMGHWGVRVHCLAISPYFSVIFIFCMKKGISRVLVGLSQRKTPRTC